MSAAMRLPALASRPVLFLPPPLTPPKTATPLAQAHRRSAAAPHVELRGYPPHLTHPSGYWPARKPVIPAVLAPHRSTPSAMPPAQRKWPRYQQIPADAATKVTRRLQPTSTRLSSPPAADESTTPRLPRITGILLL